FDWNDLGDGTVVVTLADVTGHGIGPALLASVCRAYSRANLNGNDSLLSGMQRVNNSIKQDLQTGRFVTFVAVVCREQDGSVEMLSAGHAPLFKYASNNRTLEEFEAHTVPLGILPFLHAEPTMLQMDSGDMVLLITDGFIEWENSGGEQYGTKRLAQCVRDAS